MMKKKFLIGGIIILIAIASLGFVAFRGAATYYYPVSQALEKAPTLSNKTIRIEGQVVPNSLVQVPSATNNGVKFVLADMTVSTDTIPISYQGALPDAFKEGNDAVVEGQLTPGGNFQATQIIVKCPSKYVPVTATPTTTTN
jgi:cytochrome c-type biogenesis protein CcmE